MNNYTELSGLARRFVRDYLIMVPSRIRKTWSIERKKNVGDKSKRLRRVETKFVLKTELGWDGRESTNEKDPMPRKDIRTDSGVKYAGVSRGKKARNNGTNACATVAISLGFNLIPGSLFQPEGVVNTLGRLCRTCIFTRFLREGALS